MAKKRIITSVLFQKQTVQKTDDDTFIDVIPSNRVIVNYVEGEEGKMMHGQSIIETPDIDEPSVLIETDTLNTQNPDNADLTKVGSKPMIDELFRTLTILINQI